VLRRDRAPATSEYMRAKIGSRSLSASSTIGFNRNRLEASDEGFVQVLEQVAEVAMVGSWIECQPA
jgi:hypothetical protein